MRKLTYKSAPDGHVRPIKNTIPNLSESYDSHTEYGFGGSFIEGTATDSTTSGIAKEPDLYYEESYEEDEVLDGHIDKELMDIFVELGDAMDEGDDEVLANFTDFIIKKFSSVKDINYTILFNNLLIKINNADLSNTNDILKKLTKIYSRTLKLEYLKEKNIDGAKESAYKKVLHRANQYLAAE